MNRNVWGSLPGICLVLGAWIASTGVSAQEATTDDAADVGARLERVIQGMLDGQLPAGDVVERLLATEIHPEPVSFGPVRSLRFLEAGEQRSYTFEAQHENATARWTVWLAPDSDQVSNLAWQQTSPLDAQRLRQVWGVLGDMLGHDWLRVYPSGDSFPHSFAWKDPGKSIVRKTADTETVYAPAPDGTIHYVTTPQGWELPTEHVLYPVDESTLIQRAGEDLNDRVVFRRQPNGQIVEWRHFSNDPETPVMMSAYLRADGSTGRQIAPQNGNPLRNPAAWGPFADLANARVALWGMRAPIVSADGDAMHFVRVPGGTGKPYPEFTVRLAPNGSFMMRIFSTTSRGEERGYFREGVLQGDTIEWRKPGTALMQEVWRMERSANGLLNLMTADWTNPSDWRAWVVTPTYYMPGLADEALARLEAYDKTIPGQVARQRAANIEKANAGPYNRFAQVANAVLDTGMAVYEATVPPPAAPVYGAPATATQAGGGAVESVGPGPASQSDAPGSAVAVLLWKGFQVPITPGATSNEGCFARVVVGPVTTDASKRPHEAKRAAASAEQQFLAACRTLGALGSGDFADEWYIDEKAESVYARMRANRWMHEVSTR